MVCSSGVCCCDDFQNGHDHLTVDDKYHTLLGLNYHDLSNGDLCRFLTYLFLPQPCHIKGFECRASCSVKAHLHVSADFDGR